MNTLPQIALILLRAEWFDSVVALPELVRGVQADEARIREAFSSRFDLVNVWAVNSPASLEVCRTALRTAEFDLCVLAFQVWAEDFYLLPLLNALGDRPLAVWCALPWRIPPRLASFVDVLRGSGPVGTLEGLGTLRNLGQRFSFTWGAPDELRVLDDLWAAAQAGRIQRGLRSARFGLLPARNEQMQSTFVDEFRLLADIGPSVIPLSVADLVRQIGALSTAEVDAYVSRLKADYRRVGVDDAALVLASRASLGLARLAVEQRLDVLAFNDLAPELHTSLGLRPCLYPPLLEQNGVLVGLEGDLGAATALYILQHISGSPSFFVEIWYWDEAQNIVVGGHAGVQNPAVAQPGQAWISYDYEFAQADHSPGAHFQFIARPGRVTLLQLRCTPSGWQALLASGEAVGDEPWLEGYPHAAVRLDLPLDAFVRRVAQAGSTQHWIMVYGDLRREAAALCELCQIPVEKLYE